MKSNNINVEKIARAVEADAGITLDGLRDSLSEMKAHLAGKPTAVRMTQVDVSEVVQARHRVGLSQSLFAQLMGVSVRTLQGWEQGKRNPTGAAQTLLRIAIRHPETLRELQAV